MKRFLFPLQRLLRLREQREHIARRELARCMMEVGGLEARLAALEESLQACRNEIGSSTPIAGLARALEGGLLYTKERSRRELARAEGLLEAVRETYRERFRECAALRRVREQRQAAWWAQAEKESQAEIDEMARLRHAMREVREP